MNKRNVIIRVVRREPLDLDRLVLALLALAEQLQAESKTTDNEKKGTATETGGSEAES